MNKFCIITTTFKSQENLELIINTLLEKKLAACLQNFPLLSSYIWEGEICNETEFKLLIKTKSIHFEAIKSVIKNLHEYETPEVIKVDIANGEKDYLNWIDSTTC